jgi:hypothetical protein
LSGNKEDLASVGNDRPLVLSRSVKWWPLRRAQPGLFALVDSLAKVVLTCVPEPVGVAREAAVARAQGRYARLVKSAGQAIGGDSKLAMRNW